MEVVKEIWGDIKGYDGLYKVSNFGRVMSSPRIMTNCVFSTMQTPVFSKEKIIKPYLNKKSGYCSISLVKESKKPKRHYIHRLVADVFLPNPLNKREVNHKNGVRDDNGLSNLEWCTRSENKLHRFKTGISVSARGEKHGKAKLTDLQAKEIKKLWDTGGYRQIDLAKKYKVNRNAVHFLVHGKTWKHLNLN